MHMHTTMASCSDHARPPFAAGNGMMWHWSMAGGADHLRVRNRYLSASLRQVDTGSKLACKGTCPSTAWPLASELLSGIFVLVLGMVVSGDEAAKLPRHAGRRLQLARRLVTAQEGGTLACPGASPVLSSMMCAAPPAAPARNSAAITSATPAPERGVGTLVSPVSPSCSLLNVEYQTSIALVMVGRKMQRATGSAGSAARATYRPSDIHWLFSYSRCKWCNDVFTGHLCKQSSTSAQKSL